MFDNSQKGLFSDILIYDPGAPDDDDWNNDFQLAIGEEGAINSNAGGEFNFHSFLSTLIAEAPRQFDMRDRHYRTKERTKAWDRQLPRLVDAHLKHQATGVLRDDELENEHWKIPVVDFDEYHHDTGIYTVQGAETPNETLARFGLIGGSPDEPTIAFPFHFLEIFRQIHCRFPSPSLEDQLRVSYDAYLSIQRVVQERVDAELGRNSHQHFIQNVCPPCMYRLDNETLLKPAILLAMDGNNSLKMVDAEKRSGQACLDTRYLKHPRWLDASTVDKFKDEVLNSHWPHVTTPDDISHCDGPELPHQDDVAWLNVNKIEDLQACVDTCVERWKAAGPDANKRMYLFFAISGIFVSVCRHGHVLVLCNMRRSGELMKYPLAIVKALLDQYGEDLGLGYDIMCAFYKTLLQSPQLGNKVVACRLQGVVPAFHGHAHNRKCQVSWHPIEYKESPEVAAKLDYVELLQKVHRDKNTSDEAQAKY
ncbi:hypothetical protein AAF712_015635 [Marasmius tenuissimus]|uniref:Transposase n=1 Tax=Marasmius tenuissimus TaxID=585030 RepID=A0ABR2Z7R5_9AGAR